MLNVKYIIQDNEGNMFANRNPYANGPAWFVEEIQLLPDYNSVYDALDIVDTKKIALVRDVYKEDLNGFAPKKDSLASVRVIKTAPNYMEYESTNSSDGFVVFSEAYYKNGWIATIDGAEAPILEVDYMLRGLSCLLYTSPSPRDQRGSRMPSSA